MQMNTASSQYSLSAGDLEAVLALVRSGSLAGAAERRGVDASTVFRTVQRIERGLGRRLFERTRSGYTATELALELASHAEVVETRLEAARSAAQATPSEIGGVIKITSTDTIVHSLILPLLAAIRSTHPGLQFDVHTGNEFANLTRRDADIAVRATKRPPQHLVGKHLGPIRVAPYAARSGGLRKFDDRVAASASWVAPDDALPEHPSVLWRRRRYPKVRPAYLVGSILTVAEVVACGAAIGLVPTFLAERRSDLRQIGPAIDECQSELWLLTHPEARHLRRVSAIYSMFAERLRLE